MNKPKVTFLGPLGATFSHLAYEKLAGYFHAPKGNEVEYLPASSNTQVLGMVVDHGGYGALAMETLADGRISEPHESFISLLDRFVSNDDCPVHVIGALRYEIHFALMVRHGVLLEDVRQVIAHKRAFGACRLIVESLGARKIESESNGTAAMLVASDRSGVVSAALGPIEAAREYGLDVLVSKAEDTKAVTTFFLIGPKSHRVMIGEQNRGLAVFRAKHSPGSLVDALIPFKQHRLNLTQVHSLHRSNGTYHFVAETGCSIGEIAEMKKSFSELGLATLQSISFGPFVVL